MAIIHICEEIFKLTLQRKYQKKEQIFLLASVKELLFWKLVAVKKTRGQKNTK